MILFGQRSGTRMSRRRIFDACSDAPTRSSTSRDRLNRLGRRTGKRELRLLPEVAQALNDLATLLHDVTQARCRRCGIGCACPECRLAAALPRLGVGQLRAQALGSLSKAS